MYTSTFASNQAAFCDTLEVDSQVSLVKAEERTSWNSISYSVETFHQEIAEHNQKIVDLTNRITGLQFKIKQFANQVAVFNP